MDKSYAHVDFGYKIKLTSIKIAGLVNLLAHTLRFTILFAGLV